MVEILGPPELYKDGLDAALKTVITMMRDRHRLSVSYGCKNIPEHLNGRIKMLAYMAVRELLFNIVKHAHTDTAILRLMSDGDSLTILVVDRGVGWEQSGKTTTGFGLLNLQRKIRESGGILMIQKIPAVGTSVLIKLPLYDCLQDIQFKYAANENLIAN